MVPPCWPWLIPLLLLAGLWRHVLRKIPLRYEATLWSIVFPLGMDGVGSQFLAEVERLPIVHAIGFGESWVALAAWVTTFAAMLNSIWLTLATSGLRSQGLGSTTMS